MALRPLLLSSGHPSPEQGTRREPCSRSQCPPASSFLHDKGEFGNLCAERHIHCCDPPFCSRGRSPGLPYSPRSVPTLKPLEWGDVRRRPRDPLCPRSEPTRAGALLRCARRPARARCHQLDRWLPVGRMDEAAATLLGVDRKAARFAVRFNGFYLFVGFDGRRRPDADSADGPPWRRSRKPSPDRFRERADSP